MSSWRVSSWRVTVLRWSLLASLVAATFALPASSQVIFVSPCGISIPNGTTGELTIWACIEGQISQGILLANFRVAGLPPGWASVVTPAPGTSFSTGDLFGGGASVGFAVCSSGDPFPGGRYLELYRILVLATSSVNDALLSVATTDPPTDPGFECPFVTLCDAPTFTKVCVGSHGSWVNPLEHGCPLAVEARTWGEVKAVFR